MTTNLFGLYVQNIKTGGFNLIEYFNTEKELSIKLGELKQIHEFTEDTRLFKVEHDYDRKSNVIT